MDDGVSAADAEMLAALKSMWERADPMPADFDAATLALIEAAEVMAGELEFLELVSDERQLVAVRGNSDTRTLRFADSHHEVLLRLVQDNNGTRIDGWIVPPAAGLVTLETASHPITVDVDPQGRFDFENVSAGVVALAFTAGAHTPVFKTHQFTI